MTAVQADVKDLEALRAIGRDHAITGIVHMAGSMPWPPNPDEAPAAAAREALGGLFNIIEVAQEWGVKRVSVASTIGVYGGLSNTGALSEDLPVPLTAPHVIPTFKRIGELLNNHLAKATGLEIINLRIGGAWGPLGHLPNFAFPAPQFVHAAATGTPVDLSGVGGRLKADDGLDLCYVHDLGRATALLQTADKLTHTTYNVGAGRMTTNAEVIAAIKSVVPDFELRTRARLQRAAGLPRHHPAARGHRLPAGMGPRALRRRLHRSTSAPATNARAVRRRCTRPDIAIARPRHRSRDLRSVVIAFTIETDRTLRALRRRNFTPPRVADLARRREDRGTWDWLRFRAAAGAPLARRPRNLDRDFSRSLTL